MSAVWALPPRVEGEDEALPARKRPRTAATARAAAAAAPLVHAKQVADARARQAAWRLEGLAEADAGIVRVSEVLGALGTARRAATAAAASQEARQEVARAAQALAQRSLCPAATAAAEAVLGRADCGASVGGGGDALPEHTLLALRVAPSAMPAWMLGKAEGTLRAAPAEQAAAPSAGAAQDIAVDTHAYVDLATADADAAIVYTTTDADAVLSEELASWATAGDALPEARVAEAADQLALALSQGALCGEGGALAEQLAALGDDGVQALLVELFSSAGGGRAVGQAACGNLLQVSLLPRLRALQTPAPRSLLAAALASAAAHPLAAADVLVLELLLGEGAGPIQGDVAASVAEALPLDVRPILLRSLCVQGGVWTEQTCAVAIAATSPRAALTLNNVVDLAAALKASLAAAPALAGAQRFGKLLQAVTKLDPGILRGAKDELVALASSGKGLLAKAALAKMRKL